MYGVHQAKRAGSCPECFDREREWAATHDLTGGAEKPGGTASGSGRVDGSGLLGYRPPAGLPVLGPQLVAPAQGATPVLERAPAQRPVVDEPHHGGRPLTRVDHRMGQATVLAAHSPHHRRLVITPLRLRLGHAQAQGKGDATTEKAELSPPRACRGLGRHARGRQTSRFSPERRIADSREVKRAPQLTGAAGVPG
jgi:hypothetical protein